jgi:uncharacterized membrane protein YgdD (TMEM256/DUF423 family)
MDILTDLAGLTLVAAGAFGAGFEFRMIRSRFGHQVLTPAARLFQTYVIIGVVGMIFVSNHWHNSAVTWTLTGLSVALVSAQGVLVLRNRERRSSSA